MGEYIRCISKRYASCELIVQKNIFITVQLINNCIFPEILVPPAFQLAHAEIRNSKGFQKSQLKGNYFLQTRKSRKTLA